MTDMHSHILPHVDDGSGSTQESIQMLRMLAEQGVDTVCATPHFYPTEDTPDDFFDIRDKMYKRLTEVLPQDEKLPSIRLGAEVAYFSGISRMERLADMRLQGSKVLLLEMPMIKWSNAMVREILDISCFGSVKLVLAHIERYKDAQPKILWEILRENGVYMQANSSYFVNPRTRRAAIKQLMRGEIHLLGSDAHNITERPPQMAEARRIIEEKLGTSELEAMDALSDKLLS